MRRPEARREPVHVGAGRRENGEANRRLAASRCRGTRGMTFHTAFADARTWRASRSPKRVRIVFCIDGMGVGGTELNALRTAERLDRDRYDVSVLCLQEGGPLLSRYRERDIPVLTLPLRRLHSITAV